MAIQVAEQLSDYLLTGAVTNALNMPSVTAEEAPKLKPYMDLAKQIGGFAGQLVDSGIESVTIEYEGQVASVNTKPLTAVVLEGLLQPSMDSVNMVNAPIIAKDRNIDVAEVLHDREGDYHTLIRITIKTNAGERSIAGTLFSNRSPRIVSIMGVEIEAQLSDHMLYVANDDKPGLIGGLGSILGEAGINIGTFNLGRDKKQEWAIALISVDQKLTNEVIEATSKLPNVRQVKSLSF